MTGARRLSQSRQQPLPAELAARGRQELDTLNIDTGALAPVARDALLRVLALSDFAAHELNRERDWLLQAIEADRFSLPPVPADLMEALGEAGWTTMPELQQALRRARNRAQFWIVWRHLLGLAPLQETVNSLSWIADQLIETALTAVTPWEQASLGEPSARADGGLPRLVVIALGKLGARELNLSSDVDLLFAYPEDGQTTRGRTHQQLFTRVAQRLIEALDPMTEHGFVFRVDMRLRPYGASGPLVASFGAIENYYEAQGRDWERYALIKARQVAGDPAGAELLAALRPFVFRRYLDFGALDALREMKARLVAERKDPDDVKLGPGGIRDAEFAVQVQQLIWAGREPELQCAPLLDAANTLVRLGLWEADATEQLLAAYGFLRDTEHCLQAEADRQTQNLPRNDFSRQRLAIAMGFTDYLAFTETLNAHRARVSEVFAGVIAPANGETAGETLVWDQLDADALYALGFRDPETAEAGLAELVAARDRSYVGGESRARLDRFMPLCLRAAGASAKPDLALDRALPVIHSVLRRSAYLVLLEENPQALERLLDLGSQSRWIAAELARHPAFLDAMLDDRQWVKVPDAALLRHELQQRLAHVTQVDEEIVLDVLRDFKEHHQFQAAMAEVQGTLPLMKASDYYTWLAEALLDAALGIAWRWNPPDAADLAEWRQAVDFDIPLLLVGYGKLGGIELGPGSDLDLVCLHGLPLDAAPFLHRLVRKLLHILTVPTYLGPLYEVDMRLRPSGKSGTMVSSLSSFLEYQRGGAWLWEHQALVRARPVAGDPGLAAAFADIRRDILCQPRNRAEVAQEVGTMRARMMAHKGDAHDLKQGAGGIVDIEFMVQYLVLAYAHDHPELVCYTDNVRILETVENLALLPGESARRLREAYVSLRSEWHRSLLDLPDENRAASVLGEHQAAVRDIWALLLGDAGQLDGE